MVQLIIEFSSDGVAFDWDAGVFPRQDAPQVAAMVRAETEAAVLEGEDVEFIGFRIGEVAL